MQSRPRKESNFVLWIIHTQRVLKRYCVNNDLVEVINEIRIQKGLNPLKNKHTL